MRKHRTPEQWQTLVDQQRDCGLSASKFCKQENIGYASFCNWRKRLSDPSTNDSAGSSEAGFLDLSSLMGNVPLLRPRLAHCAQPGQRR
jgi:putative transposase